MNEHSGWEALPPLSPLTIRAETEERFSCHNIQTHTYSHNVYTHVHVHSPTEPHVIQLGSCILLKCFLNLSSSPGQLPLIFFLLCFLSSHPLYHHPRSDGPQQWRRWSRTKQNLNPFNKGCRQSVNQNPPAPAHKDIHPLTRQEVMTTVCKFGKFNSIQFFFVWFTMQGILLIFWVCLCVRDCVTFIKRTLHPE